MKKKVVCLFVAIVAILTLGVQTCFATVSCPYCYAYSASIYCNGTVTEYDTKHDTINYEKCDVHHIAHYVTLKCTTCGMNSSTWSRHDVNTFHYNLNCSYYGTQPGSPCFSY